MTHFFTGLIVAGAMFAVVIGITFIVHQRRIGMHRGVSRSAFIQAFGDADIPEIIPATVYDHYKSLVISKDFSVSPDDDFEHVLAEGDEDIDDDARLLIRKLRLTIPTDYARSRSETKIVTLRDMVMWLDKVRRMRRPNG